MLRQQRLQTLHVVVVDRALSLGHGPLQAFAGALENFFAELLPAGEAVFAGQHELGVAM